MAQYTAIYSDEHGKVKTFITNEFNETQTDCLFLEIDGVRFRGSSFDDFEILNPQNYSDEQLKRFTFNRVTIFQSDLYIWELCNCNIEVVIPQSISDIEKETDIKGELSISLSLGKPKLNGGLSELHAQFTLYLNKQKFISESDSVETAFSQLQKEMLPRYWFKNCFSCHYSDYSPTGSGFFASMMCFRNNKASYLTASGKKDYFKLAAEGYIPVQETYLCKQFAPREKDTGYRGWPFEHDTNLSTEG